MSQPAYLFREEVTGMGTEGTGGTVHQFSAGEIPTAGDFNGNTNLAFAITANLSQRLETIDGIAYGGSYDADENIFTGISTSFTSLIEVIQNIKGGSNLWYTDVDAAGMSLQDLYDRDTITNWNVTGTLKTNTLQDYSGGTLTISPTNLTVSADSSFTGGLTSTDAGNFQIGTSGTAIKKMTTGEKYLGYSSTSANPDIPNAQGTIAHGLGEIPDYIFYEIKLVPDGGVMYYGDIAARVQDEFPNAHTATNLYVMVITQPTVALGATRACKIYLQWTAVVLA